jgi:hypothetical protein
MQTKIFNPMNTKHALYILMLFGTVISYAQQAKEYAVSLTAVVTHNPAGITLNWKKDSIGTGYNIFRKSKDAFSWGNPLATLPAQAISFTDNLVALGNGYEYYVQRTYSLTTRLAHGYIYVGIQKTIEPNKGKLLLLIDAHYEQPLATEINQLKVDLMNDGWVVETAYIQRNATVKMVKSKIAQSSMVNPGKPALQMIYILGHIPVPYSGGFKAEQGFVYPPDGHFEHGGAWSTDMYYASLNETIWTDNSVDDLSPDRTENKNTIDDGKFDLMYLGDDTLSIQIGRVDLFNMPIFNQSDTDLVRQYLHKAHAYKTAQTIVNRRGLIDDGFGALSGEAPSASAYRDFSVMFGDSVLAGDYLTNTKKGNYLFTYGAGDGNYTSASGIANTSLFKNDSINQIFTFLFGSYFGDWDSQNNFLRAPLASKNGGLASAWSGRPHWHIHHMALGSTIGYSTMLTQNNFFNNTANPSGYVHNYGSTFVSINLMGDPSLRLHMRNPMGSITASTSSDSLTTTLSWNPVVGASGYWIAKTPSIDDGFSFSEKVDSNTTSWNDVKPFSGMTNYMVRPIFLEQTPSGSYYNLGLGAVDSAFAQYKVGLAEQSNGIDYQVTVYPNPAKDWIAVTFPTDQNGVLSLYDIQGKLLLKVSDYKPLQLINVSAFHQGYYVVNIQTNAYSIFKKITIQ